MVLKPEETKIGKHKSMRNTVITSGHFSIAIAINIVLDFCYFCSECDSPFKDFR